MAFWRHELSGNAVGFVTTVFCALGAAYVVMGAKVMALGTGIFGFADFHALWVSGVLAHDGQALINYDGIALHAEQVRQGIDAHRENPFPYPPILLLLLAPLGGLSLAHAFAVFMIGGAALFVLAMTGGRFSDWRWWVASLAAPASGITIISGQSGFLTGALAVGGLRMAAKYPAAAGLLFALLAFKPQLGLMAPIVLIAAGLWRTIGYAICWTGLLAFASVLAFGFEVWPAWVRQIVSYADDFHAAYDLMPTVYAGAMLAGASKAVAGVSQLIAAGLAAAVAARAARQGWNSQTVALALVGTFLVTPHAFNYDMPMTSAAMLLFIQARFRGHAIFHLGEVVILALAFVWPFAVLALHGLGAQLYWLPIALLFAVMAPRSAWPKAVLTPAN